MKSRCTSIISDSQWLVVEGARTGLAAGWFDSSVGARECWWPTWRYCMRVDAAALQRYLLFPTRLLQALRLLATLRVSQIPPSICAHLSQFVAHQELDSSSRTVDPTPLLPNT